MIELFDIERIWWIILTAAITTFFTVFVGTWIKASVEEQRKERIERKEYEKASDDATKYLYKFMILQSCQQWEEKGYCPMNTKEVLSDMVNIYHKLGGNSFISDVYDKCMELPNEK